MELLLIAGETGNKYLHFTKYKKAPAKGAHILTSNLSEKDFEVQVKWTNGKTNNFKITETGKPILSINFNKNITHTNIHFL